MDLGKKTKSPGAIAPTPESEKEPKVTFPGLNFSDDTADKFFKEVGDVKIGEEYAGTVRLRVTSLTDDEYGKRIGFDVMELDDIAEEGEETEEKVEAGAGESDDEETKALGYKRKTPEKETPSLKAADLAE